MSQPSQAFYDCAEAKGNQLYVDGFPNGVYIHIASDEEDAVLINRESVQKLVEQLNSWLDKTKGEDYHKESL